MNKPRLGFLGAGWIGRHRLAAVAQSGQAEIAWICDSSPAMLAEAGAVAPGAKRTDRYEALLGDSLDGIVIATPSALHAQQSVQALERGCAVFCQKPLGRNGAEVGRVVEAARTRDRLLGVDLSYRFTAGIRCLKQLLEEGALGQVYAADLVFHNGYGPDKPWFFQPELSGGGCVMDLGIHLADLGLWALNSPQVRTVNSRLYRQGRPLANPAREVEDYAACLITLADGTVLQLACSWNLPVGCDAVIRASFFGTKGGLSFQNVNGSFYDFTLERFAGTKRETIVQPPDDWGGKAILHWVETLAAGNHFDSSTEHLTTSAELLDRIYAAAVS